MFQFLLTQIAKLKKLINATDAKIESKLVTVSDEFTVSATGTFGPNGYNNTNKYIFLNAYASDNNLYEIRARIDSGYYYFTAFNTSGQVITNTTINVTFVFWDKQ